MQIVRRQFLKRLEIKIRLLQLTQSLGKTEQIESDPLLSAYTSALAE